MGRPVERPPPRHPGQRPPTGSERHIVHLDPAALSVGQRGQHRAPAASRPRNPADTKQRRRPGPAAVQVGPAAPARLGVAQRPQSGGQRFVSDCSGVRKRRDRLDGQFIGSHRSDLFKACGSIRSLIPETRQSAFNGLQPLIRRILVRGSGFPAPAREFIRRRRLTAACPSVDRACRPWATTLPARVGQLQVDQDHHCLIHAAACPSAPSVSAWSSCSPSTTWLEQFPVGGPAVRRGCRTGGSRPEGKLDVGRHPLHRPRLAMDGEEAPVGWVFSCLTSR